MTEFAKAVYEATRRIPRGKVATYGQIALIAGRPNAARAVGQILHRNPEQGITPCHRVVFADGSLASGFAFGGSGVQAELLNAEGVETVAAYGTNGGVVRVRGLGAYLWDGRGNGGDGLSA